MRVVTLYKTPSPGISIKSGEFYELALGNEEGRGLTLREFHGNWDGVKGRSVPGASGEVISPPGGYASLEEGNAAFDERKVFRARQGFLHGLVPTFNPTTKTQGGFYEFVDPGTEI
jgi:hypothetical protein